MIWIESKDRSAVRKMSVPEKPPYTSVEKVSDPQVRRVGK